MFKKFLLVFFVWLSFFLSVFAAEDDKPVVIAISPFFDFSRGTNSLSNIMSLRDKVTANLLQNYNCIVLSRSNSFALSYEHALNILDQINKEQPEPIFLPAADFAVSGFFKIARRTPGHNRSVDLGCTLLISDLNNNPKEDYTKKEFIPDESSLYATDVTLEIAKALNLKPRRQQCHRVVGKIDETWAVLPIKRLESNRSMTSPPDQTLAIRLELSLQESGKIKQIVDHNEINKVLGELKITSFSNATEGIAGGIAKIIGADKVIMGSVSKANQGKKELRLDLFLVDGKTALIVDCVTATTDPEKLSEKASQLVLSFLNRKKSGNKLLAATSKNLEKEAKMYRSGLWYLMNVKSAYKALYAKEFADMAYLVSHKRSKEVEALANTLIHYLCDMTSFADIPSNEKRKLLDFAQKLYMMNGELLNKPNVILNRATAYQAFDDTLPKALALLQDNIDKFKDPRKLKKVKSEIVFCYYKMGDFDKTLEYAKKTNDKFLLVSVYRAINDRVNDEKELALLNQMKLTKTDYSIHHLRLFQLTNRLKGPQEAFRLTKKISGGTVWLNAYQLELAKVFLALGNKEAAAMILEGIQKETLEKNSDFRDIYYKPRNEKKDNLALYGFLKQQVGDYKTNWKPLASSLKIPGKYKIYIQPLMGTDKDNLELVHQAVPIIESNIKCRVVVFPQLPLPDDAPYCFGKGSGRYDAFHVIERLKRIRKVPEDAFVMVFVTPEPIGRFWYGIVDTLAYQGGRIFSYNRFYYLDQYDMAKTLAKGVLATIGILSYPFCRIKSCLMSCDGIRELYVTSKNLKICINCQKKYNDTSAEDLYKTFQKLYNKQPRYNGSPSSIGQGYDSRAKQERYNRIITQALLNAKKQAAEESNKPVNYLPSIKLDKAPAKGLKYQYYEFEKDACKLAKDLSSRTPSETGIVDMFKLEKAKRKDNYGLIFGGYIKVPVDGKYQFYLTSDDGSRLWIDDKEIIENDKMQAPFTKIGEIGLKAGYHKIKVSFIQGKGGAFLSLYWRGPKTLGQEVPAEVLFHKE